MGGCVCVCSVFENYFKSVYFIKVFLHSHSYLKPLFYFFLVIFSLNNQQIKNSHEPASVIADMSHIPMTVVHFLTSSSVSGSGAVSPKSGN